jgi:hypothetical protein
VDPIEFVRVTAEQGTNYGNDGNHRRLNISNYNNFGNDRNKGIALVELGA